MRSFLLHRFTFHGRTSRYAFLRSWLTLCYLTGINLVAAIFLASQGFPFAGYLGIILQIVLVSLNLSNIVRRFHDRGRSGWWLVAMLCADVGSYQIAGLEQRYPAAFLSLGTTLVAVHVWFIAELFFRRGTPGPNPFGEDPSTMPRA